MIVIFDKEYLKELYELGQTKDEQHCYQPDTVRLYKRCIDMIINISDITSLYKYKILDFKKLHGNKKDLFSVRVGNQYHIEFAIIEMQDEIVTTICNIIKLSKYYI